MPEEEKYGIEPRLDERYPKDSIGFSLGRCDPLRKAKHAVLLVPPLAVTVSAAILSSGAVAALFFFIHLSFLHPDAANVLVPLLLTFALPELLKFWHSRKEKKNDHS